MIVDVAIVAVLGLFVWRGMRRGLIASLTGLVGFVIATAAAVLGFGAVAAVLRPALGLSDGVANLAAAMLIFVSLTVGFSILGRILTKVLRLTKLGSVNAAAGASLSGLWALSWIAAVLLATTAIPLSDGTQRTIDNSALARGIIREAPGWASRIARTDLRRMLLVFTPEQEPVAFAATTDFRRAPDAERALFDRLNAERASKRLRELTWDEDLAAAARAHAADMYRRGYFGHETPEGLTPGDRLRARDIRFAVTGENLALAPSSAIAHGRLMASERHRAHILGDGFTRVGVGVMFGPNGLLVTQEFTG